eukprot:10114682-Alexandrium_andersonii.AAC.1
MIQDAQRRRFASTSSSTNCLVQFAWPVQQIDRVLTSARSAARSFIFFDGSGPECNDPQCTVSGQKLRQTRQANAFST